MDVMKNWFLTCNQCLFPNHNMSSISRIPLSNCVHVDFVTWRKSSKWFKSLRTWIHTCKAECKANHGNRKWTEQHIKTAASNVWLWLFYYCSPPLVIFVQLCSDQGFATTSGSMLRLKTAPCLWTKPKLKKTTKKNNNFCFDCIIRTSVVPAGAL